MRVEAKYYSAIDGTIHCQLCPNNCHLTEAMTGPCRTRKVIDGRLYTQSFGNPCSIHTDPIEKKPLYHFHPGSNTFSIGVAGCLLHCKNCQNHTISQTFPNDMPLFSYTPDIMINECIKRGCHSISYTYTEPFAFFEYTLEIAKLAKKSGLKNILVSSAYVNEEPLKELLPFIDAANIDLKCFSDSVYKKLCKGSLEPILRNLKIIREAGLWLEITNLLIPGWTDDMDMIELMCGWLATNGFEKVPLHFSRFYPMFEMENVPSTPIATMENAANIAKQAGLLYVYCDNIEKPNNTYCPNCQNLLIQRLGFDISVNIAFKSRCPKCDYLIDGVFE
jgi:pyruvate formate lyase activating enzyme